jgi:threonine/homoserine/homoserine lactone efflux protein
MEGGGWLLLILDIVGAALLAGALIYGITMWRKRPKSPAAERRSEEVVRENYRRGG